jgi:hypothetical protein
LTAHHVTRHCDEVGLLLSDYFGDEVDGLRVALFVFSKVKVGELSDAECVLLTD